MINGVKAADKASPSSSVQIWPGLRPVARGGRRGRTEPSAPNIVMPYNRPNAVNSN